jgi:hypothetical protein
LAICRRATDEDELSHIQGRDIEQVKAPAGLTSIYGTSTNNKLVKDFGSHNLQKRKSETKNQ